jgi:membrane-bound serine protease (ClpP class)
VVADGDFIAAGARLRIVEIEGNRIVVAEDGEAGEVTIGFLIFLMVIGLGLVIAEVFFVSFGILAVLAAVSLISSVFLAFTEYGQGTGFVMLTVAAAGLPTAVYMALKLLPKTGLGKTLILSGTELDMDKASREPGIEKLLGQRGRTLSDLRPAGFARIEGKKVDVITRGEMLGADVLVTVIEVEGNRVVVAEDHDTEPSGTD